MEPGCLANYPEKGATPGWYFRIRESSATVWLVEGSDADGRTVSRQGLDEDQLLAECEANAPPASTTNWPGHSPARPGLAYLASSSRTSPTWS